MIQRQLYPFFVLGLVIFAALCGQAQEAPRPALLELPLSARLAGSAESLGAPLSATLGDVLAQPALLDTTHDGQLHLGYMDYFSGTAQAAALYARRPKDHQWMWHTGLRNFGFGSFTARDPAGIETGRFTASDVAWVSGAAIPLDSNLTLGTSLWLGQSTLADRRSNFSQLDLGLSYFRADRQFRLAALWRPWGGSDQREWWRNFWPLRFRLAIVDVQGIRQCPFCFDGVIRQPRNLGHCTRGTV